MVSFVYLLSIQWPRPRGLAYRSIRCTLLLKKSTDGGDSGRFFFLNQGKQLFLFNSQMTACIILLVGLESLKSASLFYKRL